MIDERTQTVLRNVVRREGRSLLQYVSEASPWTTLGEQGALTRLQEMVSEERDAVATVVRLLGRHHVTPPHLGSFPMTFTTINFVALDHLLPQLAAGGRRAVADLEHDLSTVTDPEILTLLQQIHDMKGRHQKELEEMAVAHPEAAAR